jgi:hypothetical protein
MEISEEISSTMTIASQVNDMFSIVEGQYATLPPAQVLEEGQKETVHPRTMLSYYIKTHFAYFQFNPPNLLAQKLEEGLKDLIATTQSEDTKVSLDLSSQGIMAKDLSSEMQLELMENKIIITQSDLAFAEQRIKELQAQYGILSKKFQSISAAFKLSQELAKRRDEQEIRESPSKKRALEVDGESSRLLWRTELEVFVKAGYVDHRQVIRHLEYWLRKPVSLTPGSIPSAPLMQKCLRALAESYEFS